MRQAKVLVGSLLVTLVVLMGGFLASQWWFVTKPIHQTLDQQSGLHPAKINVMPTEVRLHLHINPTYDFIQRYPRLLDKLEQTAGHRKLTVVLDNPRYPELEQAWSDLQFALREAVVTKRYTLIPDAVKQVARQHRLTYKVRIDERFVYVELQQADRTWRQVVPLQTDRAEALPS
ncbi:hypothetical protein [Laceyella tengchongensis]|jgi:hypothetical protein|uniref:hypothetical protein n=1 Tax=Laceyella tengchongensis TaxID=574699 RepID=UPI0012B7CFFE|nr:hypothetical protein [Laceyella tengchongensis]